MFPYERIPKLLKFLNKNSESNLKKYRAKIVRIMHEHVLIWKRSV
jgi:hypothetical protein